MDATAITLTQTPTCTVPGELDHIVTVLRGHHTFLVFLPPHWLFLLSLGCCPPLLPDLQLWDCLWHAWTSSRSVSFAFSTLLQGYIPTPAHECAILLDEMLRCFHQVSKELLSNSLVPSPTHICGPTLGPSHLLIV